MDQIGAAAEGKNTQPQGEEVCFADPFGKRAYKHMKHMLKGRVSQQRYDHSKGVAKTAVQLAKIYGVDPGEARIAGIIHDWDKECDIQTIQNRARVLCPDEDQRVIDDMPWLLHGPTAAASLRQSHPEFGDAVFQAVARHTSGASDMSPLDCIIYVADIIEPNRVYGKKKDDIDALKREVGILNLQDLYFHAFKITFLHLVKENRRMHPHTVDVWNALMNTYSKHRKSK